MFFENVLNCFSSMLNYIPLIFTTTETALSAISSDVKDVDQQSQNLISPSLEASLTGVVDPPIAEIQKELTVWDYVINFVYYQEILIIILSALLLYITKIIWTRYYLTHSKIINSATAFDDNFHPEGSEPIEELNESFRRLSQVPRRRIGRNINNLAEKFERPSDWTNELWKEPSAGLNEDLDSEEDNLETESTGSCCYDCIADSYLEDFRGRE